MAFRFQRLQIPEVLLIEAQPVGDDRGFFMETYKRSELSANGIPQVFVQEEADILYKVTEEYTPELDWGIVWNDPEIGIRWSI